MKIKVLLFALSVILLSACSKDSSDPFDLELPAATQDPANLEEGKAEVAVSGTRDLTLPNASCRWDQTWYDNGYYARMLSISDTAQKFGVLLVLYSQDSLGKYGTAPIGEYLFQNETPSEKDPGRDKMVRILVYADPRNIEPFSGSERSIGAVKISSNENDILEGEFWIVAIGNIYGEDKQYYNLRGSFKAPKE